MALTPSLVSISRRALASTLRIVRTILCAWSPASLPRPFFVLGARLSTRRLPTGRVDRVPARSYRPLLARRSLVRSGWRARPPPFAPRGAACVDAPSLDERSRDASGRPACLRWGYRIRVGRVPAATPVHSTDVCCSRILLSEMIPQVSMHATALFPTRCGSSRFTPSSSLRRTVERAGALSSPVAVRRRTSDASSLRGLPRRSYVHRRRPAVACFSDLGSYPRA